VDDDLPADGSSQQLSDATWFSVSLTRTQKEWLGRIAGLCGVSLQQLLTGLVLWHWRLPWERLGEPPAGGRQDHVRILLDHRQWRRLKLLAAEAKLQIGDYLQSASLGRVRAPVQRVVPWLLSTAEVELRRVIHCLAEHGWRDGHHLPGHGLATQLETCANRIERACFELPESDREYTRELTRLTRILRAQRQMALGTKDTWAQIDAVMEKLQEPK
jgi:hypothetical protein